MTVRPYRPAVRAGDFIYVSGQLAMRDGVVVGDDIAAQTSLALANVEDALRVHGADRSHIIKTSVLLSDMANWPAMNEPYIAFFSPGELPARVAFGVELTAGALIEIDAVAYVGD